MFIRHLSRCFFSAAIAAACTAAPLEARAQDPQEQESEPPPEARPHGTPSRIDVELAAELSYVTPPIRGGANPFGLGFGARAGLMFSGFYAGLSVLDYLGERDVDVSYRALLFGVELGYGVRVPVLARWSFTLRPRVGIGDAAVSYTDPSLAADVVTSASGSSVSDTLTVNNVYLRPALTAMLGTDAYFAAVDASMLVLPGIAYGGADATTWLCYGLQTEVGLRF